MDDWHPNQWHVEDKYSTDVWNTSVESLQPALPRGNSHHRSEYEHIGEEDREGVGTLRKDDSYKAIETVDTGAGTGKAHDILMEAEGVGEDVRVVKWEPLDEERHGEDHTDCSWQDEYPYFTDHTIG